MKNIEALVAALAGILMVGFSARWGLVPAAALAVALWLWRERTSDRLFGAVTAFLGVFWAILNRQPWWLGGVIFWLPITIVSVASDWLGLEWGRWRRPGSVGVALGLWFLIIGYVS